MFARLIPTMLLALVVPAACVAPATAETRRWSDKTGKFSVEAELVEAKQDSVVLKKPSGSTVTVPLARLSNADLEYLKTLAKSNAKSSNKGDAQPNLVFPDSLTEPPAWNDANTPFDMAAFLRPLPPEENAALLYLEAFYQFSPYDMVDILYPDMSQEEMKKRYDTFRSLSKQTRLLEEAWEKDPKSVDPAAVDAWLPNFDVGFEKLAAAQQRPKCMFQPGYSPHSLVPHNQAARGVYRIVAWRTRRDLERGDLERPLQDLKMLFRLRRDLQVRGGIITQFVAFAFDERCCELVRTILNAPGIHTGQCDRILAQLAEHEAKSIDAFVEANRADYISCRQALHDLQHRTGSFDPQTMKEVWALDGDTTTPLACFKLIADLRGNNPKALAKVARLQGRLLPGAWQGGKMLSDEDYAKEVAVLNRYFTTILALAEQPNFRQKGEADIKAAEAPILETTLASFVILPQSQSSLIRAIRRSEAHLRGTQCLVALKRWQLEHAAKAPPDLAMLVKAAGMPGVPLDPYSDQPLRMGSVAGQPVIYSVGADGKDDKAQVEWNFYADGPGDFIFRFEPRSK